MTTASFATVTELPGIRATAEQRSMLLTRYHLARQFCRDREVLEVACGSGIGLGYLARDARRVVGVDIDESVLQFARDRCDDCHNIAVQQADAHQLPFESASFDTVLLFEAIYYLADPLRFVSEAYRVLRPAGALIVCSVNCDWHGFNPSPFSRQYLNGAEIGRLLQQNGFQPRIQAGFPDVADSVRRRTVSLVRRLAVSSHLIPRTMRGKEWLKRIFYGPLQPLPRELADDTAPLGPLTDLDEVEATRDFKVIYVIGTSQKRPATGRRAA